MPWAKDHKSETRERILEAAAAAFRAEGVAAVSVADVMARAGLTHGGFYAHFASKEELVAEAVAFAGQSTRADLGGDDPDLPTAARLRALVDGYLSPGHRAHPERGCPIAAIAPELSRTGGPARRTLAAGIRRRLDQLRGLLPPGPDAARDRDRKAAAALACMVGGIVLARGLGEKEGQELLEDCRAFLHESLAGTETPRRRSARRRRSKARANRTGDGKATGRRNESGTGTRADR